MLRLRKGFKIYHTNLSMTDLMMNLILGFVFLFIISFILISINDNKANIQTKAEIVVTLDWNGDSRDDIDLWMQDPNGEIIYFGSKERGLMHLDRDDLGHSKDSIYGPDGKLITAEINQEIATIRGNVPGEWTVNVHMYRKNTSKPPSDVVVKVEKLNPSLKSIAIKTYKMGVNWEEITVVRFTLSASGEVLSIDNTPKALVGQKIMVGPGAWEDR